MGSRAILIVCRSKDVARERFGILEDEEGVCYTRTGRRFFEDRRWNASCSQPFKVLWSGVGSGSDSRRTGCASTASSCPGRRRHSSWCASNTRRLGQQRGSAWGRLSRALQHAVARGVDVGALLEQHKVRQDLAERFAQAYRHYCWPVESLRDIRIAPFHVMATEGAVHTDKDHVWHMTTISSFVDPEGGLLMATPYQIVDLADPASEAAATGWWTALTESGGEGAVVKPLSFVATGSRGLLQPAVKCRGREYLRIIYGPEYTLPEHLERLRERGLSGKRSLALREFALGIEGLERFVQREPSGAFTSACSACSPWRASRSIRACSRSFLSSWMRQEQAQAKKRRGDHRLGSSGPPPNVRGSRSRMLRECNVRSCAVMSRQCALRFNDFTGSAGGALCRPSRSRRGCPTARRSMWGVSDPLCHPPIFGPAPCLGGRSRPRCMSRSSGRTARVRGTRRVRRMIRLSCAPAFICAVRTADRFCPELAFI